MKKYIIFGVSAYLSDIIDIIHANGGKLAKLYMNMPEVSRERTMGFRERLSLLDYKVEVHDNMSSFKLQKGFFYALGTPSPHKNKLTDEIKSKHSLKFTPLVHPSVILGSNVKVGEGVVINVNATIGPNASLGDFCMINRCVSVGHETQIGRHALIGPAAAIAGSVTISECATIAMSATVLEQLRIGAWSYVGAGSLVTKDVPENAIVYGVPAKFIRTNEEHNFQKYIDNRSHL